MTNYFTLLLAFSLNSSSTYLSVRAKVFNNVQVFENDNKKFDLCEISETD